MGNSYFNLLGLPPNSLLSSIKDSNPCFIPANSRDNVFHMVISNITINKGGGLAFWARSSILNNKGIRNSLLEHNSSKPWAKLI